MYRKVHCLEQSGTFKNEFIKLGVPAEDYDILNDFGETNNQCDLFKHIERAYDNENSLFDNISEDDLVFAFFPCIRFSNQSYMWFQGTNYAQRNWTDEQKLEYGIKLHKQLNDLYELISKLVIVCIRRKIKLVIENPYSQEHYLTRYWSIRAKVIDKNRKLRGDYYSKPTQYFFVGFEPFENFIPDQYEDKGHATIVNTHDKTERSLISKEYANHFIRERLLPGVELKQTTIFDFTEEE